MLWVLEDAEKHKWSKSIFVLSHLYNEKIGHNCYIVGITSAGEIVFMPVGHVNPNFHLFLLQYGEGHLYLYNSQY